MTGIYLSIAIALGGALFLNRNQAIRRLLVVCFTLLQVGFTVYSFLHPGASGEAFFRADALGLLMLGVLTIISIPAVIHSEIYLSNPRETNRTRAIYCAALILLITAMGAACLSSNIAVTWIFVELTTLSASALIYHHRNERSLEGTWKYVFLCAISVTFIFIGILFLSLALRQTGTTDLSYEQLMLHASALDPSWLKLAFLFIFTGFTAKMGLVPMYTAGIDAKDKAPAPAGALFSSVLMNMGFVGIFRIYEVTAQTSILPWANTVMVISAILSIFVATVYMMRVTNFKRMLGYSSIEHMGLVILGLTAGGVGYYAAILHLVLHSFVKSSLFFQFNQVYQTYQSKSLPDTGFYFRYNLAGALVVLTGYFFATAIPPSGLFVSEWMIFRALFEGHHLLLLLVVMILLTTIIWAFGRSIFAMLFAAPPQEFDASRVVRIHPLHSLSQYLLLALSVVLGLFPPDSLVALIQEAVQSLPL